MRTSEDKQKPIADTATTEDEQLFPEQPFSLATFPPTESASPSSPVARTYSLNPSHQGSYTGAPTEDPLQFLRPLLPPQPVRITALQNPFGTDQSHSLGPKDQLQCLMHLLPPAPVRLSGLHNPLDGEPTYSLKHKAQQKPTDEAVTRNVWPPLLNPEERELPGFSGKTQAATGLFGLGRTSLSARRPAAQIEVSPWGSPHKSTPGYHLREQDGALVSPSKTAYFRRRIVGTGAYGETWEYASKKGVKRAVKRQLPPDPHHNPKKAKGSSAFNHHKAKKEHNNLQMLGRAGFICPAGQPTRHGSDNCSEPHIVVMDFIDGVTLQAYFEKAILNQSHEEQINAISILAAKLETCVTTYHKTTGLMHGDLKPDNIMVTNPKADLGNLEFKLVDQGTATAMGKPVDGGDINGQFYKEIFTDEIADARHDILAITRIAKFLIQTIDEQQHAKKPTDTPPTFAEAVSSPSSGQRRENVNAVLASSPGSPLSPFRLFKHAHKEAEDHGMAASPKTP